MSKTSELPVDTTIYRTSFVDTLAIFEREGFVKIYEETFTSKPDFDDEDAVEDTFVVYWNDGIMLTAESYRGGNVNSSSMFYNWTPETVEDRKLMSSGHYYEKNGLMAIAGDHDIRANFVEKLEMLKAHGTFSPTWDENPHVWIFNYNEVKAKGFDFQTAISAKIATFPQYVRDAIKL